MTRTAKGTGIGLSSNLDHIVRAHSGHVEVASSRRRQRRLAMLSCRRRTRSVRREEHAYERRRESWWPRTSRRSRWGWKTT